MEENYILPFLWMRGESPEIIQTEIEKIAECGIKAICLESRPHPDFMGAQWWSDLEYIITLAKARKMKVWILDDAHFPTGYANGLIKEKYPERKKTYLRYNVVNVWGKQSEVTIHVKNMLKPLINFTELDKPVDFEERAKNKLLAVVAYPLCGDNKLDETGAIDLTGEVKGDFLSYRFPNNNYRVFVIYETKTDGGKADYINMLDEESVSTLIEAVYQPHFEHFAAEFGQTIAGFFSDEPEIGNLDGFLSDTQIGSNMPLPWSSGLLKALENRYGGHFKNRLPYLWAESLQMQECPQIRHDFMDEVTRLYQECFSRQLGKWCQEHRVDYIGHVVEDDNLHQRLGNGTGHFFRAMAGQHMAGIDVIGDQVVIGDRGYTRCDLFQRSGAFFHYALAKLGASSGHLDPQKQGRTMCELFGASGWQTGTRDMKYILDHLLVRGINYLVPHAFSMAEYPDADCPPHFYARGKNPQFRYFKELMKYANRMCQMLNGGTHGAAVAVLYPAEAEWSGKAMQVQEPARELQEHQIEFDFISADMLSQPGAYNGAVNKSSFTINGQEFHYLIILEGTYITAQAYEFIRCNPGIKVIFINQKPQGVTGKAVAKEVLTEDLRERETIPLTQLGSFLQKQELAGIRLVEEFKELVYYQYQKKEKIHVFHNESAFDTFRGKIVIPLEQGAVYYDALEDSFYRLPVKEEDGKKLVEIELPPYGLGIVLDLSPGEYPVYQMLSQKLVECCRSQKLDEGWSYSLSMQKDYPEFSEKEKLKQLKPVSDLIPEFSGHICYETELRLNYSGAKAYLEFTEVYEGIELWVNGKNAGNRFYPPYVFEVTELLYAGENNIRAVVTTTLDRDQINYPEPFIIIGHHVTEPAGLSGDVILHLGQRS